MEYGINVNNKYGFLSDEEAEDPEVLLKKAIQRKDAKLAEEKKIAEQKAAAAAEAEASAIESKRVANKENRKETTERGRGGRGRGRGGEGRDGQRRRDQNKPQGEDGAPRAPRGARVPNTNRPRRERPPRVNEPGAENNQGGEEARLSDDAENRRGRGARVFRRAGIRTPGTRLDRKSGSDQTGVRSIDKKDGHGKGNWGTEQDELAAAEDVNASSGTEVEREKTEEELKREAELEKAARELTLSEFKARIAADKPEFNIRKAGEGVDNKNLPKLVPIQREAADDHIAEEVVIVRREPKSKKLNIEVNFADENRVSRGGRGGNRGGSRGGVRGTKDGRRKDTAHFDLTQEAFPALGAR